MLRWTHTHNPTSRFTARSAVPGRRGGPGGRYRWTTWDITAWDSAARVLGPVFRTESYAESQTVVTDLPRSLLLRVCLKLTETMTRAIAKQSNILACCFKSKLIWSAIQSLSGQIKCQSFWSLWSLGSGVTQELSSSLENRGQPDLQLWKHAQLLACVRHECIFSFLEITQPMEFPQCKVKG